MTAEDRFVLVGTVSTITRVDEQNAALDAPSYHGRVDRAYECRTCGAIVRAQGRDYHDMWHRLHFGE